MVATDLETLVAALRREVEQARFHGADPELVVDPADPPLVIVAKALAAERTNVPLRLGDARLSLQEDVAEHLFYRGVTALRSWNFTAAQEAFEEASARTMAPVLQQRLALFRAITALLRRVVLTDPDQTPHHAAEERALALVPALDALSPAERAHYTAELRRLIALRRAVAHDPYLQTVHCLLRAQLASSGGDEILGLGWLLRAATLNAARLAPSPYLADLLARARHRLQHFLGNAADLASPPAAAHSSEAPAEAAAEASAAVPVAELLSALASHLSRIWERDVRGDAAQFGVTLYHDA
ncbi:MAG TPA: hypothetical protein VFB73_06070 [Chloroflexota bacterium]|nr:hypothetical protein [Chloroflexota bacterium]